MAKSESQAKQLREKTVTELEEHLVKLKRDMFDLTFKHGTRQLEDTSSLSKARHELARTITVLGEKKRAEA